MKSVEVTPALKAALGQQERAFKEKFGRAPNPDDPIFFDPDCDTPSIMDEQKLTLQIAYAMADAGIEGRLIFCWVMTGLILTEETYETAETEVRTAWDSACEEWAALSRQQRRALQRQWAKAPSKEGR